MRPPSPRFRFAARLIFSGTALGWLVSAGSAATAPRAPRISPTYPAPAEQRSPDRTLANTALHATELIVYSPDGRQLATAGEDKTVRLWDARTGEQGTGNLLESFTVPSASIAALGFKADGKGLFSLGEDQKIDAWDPTTGKALPLVGATKAVPRVSLFRPGNEPELAECTSEGAKLWNWRTGAVVREFSTGGEPTRVLAFTPDGKTLIGATRLGSLCLWNAETGAKIRTFETRTPVVALVASPTHVATANARGGLQVWPLAEGPPLTFAGSWPVAFSPKGDMIAATVEQAVVVWDVETGTLLCGQEGHTSDIVAIAFNPNGQKMASADRKGTVNYWTVPLAPLASADLERIAAAVPATASGAPKKPRRILVFWRSDAILHKGGVPAANHAIKLMGDKTGAYATDFSRDYAALDPKVLAKYDAIVLNSTAHLVIPDAAKKALLNFARDGGGVIGIHAAIDTFKDWPQGAAIVGATFAGHPWGPAGTWAVKLEQPEHPLLRAWGGKNFTLHDEFYEMGEPYSRADRRVLLTVDVTDPKTARPGAEPLHRADRDFALAWIKRFGAGRVFYGGFGHIVEPFQNPTVLRFYLDGIQYALGDLQLAAADEAPDASPRTP